MLYKKNTCIWHTVTHVCEYSLLKKSINTLAYRYSPSNPLTFSFLIDGILEKNKCFANTRVTVTFDIGSLRGYFHITDCDKRKCVLYQNYVRNLERFRSSFQINSSTLHRHDTLQLQNWAENFLGTWFLMRLLEWCLFPLARLANKITLHPEVSKSSEVFRADISCAWGFISLFSLHKLCELLPLFKWEA